MILTVSVIARLLPKKASSEGSARGDDVDHANFLKVCASKKFISYYVVYHPVWYATHPKSRSYLEIGM